MDNLIESAEVTLLWKDNIWDQLLDSLDDRNVIPMVGSDLITIESDGVTLPLDR